MGNAREKSFAYESAVADRSSGGSPRLLIASIAAALIYWLLEAVSGSVWFDDGSFFDQLFSTSGHEISMRLATAVLIVAFGVFAQRNISKQRCLQEKLARYNMKLEERVALRTTELAAAIEKLRQDIERRRVLEIELDRHRHHLEEMLDQRAGELKEINLQLEREVVERKQAEETLLESERQLHQALCLAGVGSWQVDFSTGTFRMSPTLMDIYGLDEDCITIEEGFQRVHPDDRVRARQALEQTLKGESVALEYRVCQPSGEVLNVFSPDAYLVRDSDGKPSKLIGITQDITERKQVEREATIAGQIMEAKHAALTEKNVTLKNIIQQVDAEKNKIKTEIRANVEHLVMPTLRLLRRKADAPMVEYVDLLDSSLKDVTSPFVNRLESNFARLSPGEIEICDLIRKGLSSKEIAEIRDVSIQTISMQRKRIRKKLDIANKGVSLPALLKSLT